MFGSNVGCKSGGWVLGLVLGISLIIMTVSPVRAADQQVVRLETSMGIIDIALDAVKAPKTVENFIEYVNAGFYSGTIFHRVIPGFMIQGGGLDEAMNKKKTNNPVENEAFNGLKNDKYTIAMARTGDPHSATSQFFINVKDNSFLNFKAKQGQGWGYCVFGRVVQGKDVVDAIAKVKTTSKAYHKDVPVSAVIITKATVIK